MDVTVVSQPWAQVGADWLVVPLTDPIDWSAPLKALDQSYGGVLARLDATGELPVKPNALLALRGLAGGTSPRMLLVGLGKEVTAGSVERALHTAVRAICDKPETRPAFVLPTQSVGSVSPEAYAKAIVSAAVVGVTGQDLYKAERARYPFPAIQLVSAGAANAGVERASERGRILGEAVSLTRELVNRPAAEITPSGFAQRAEQLARQLGLKCQVWDQTRLVQERMQALLAVSQGSSQPPRLVQLEYRGGGAEAPTWAFVGKGVTFDSGGLSLKPTDGMLTMKCDMAGAATVLGAMTAIAKLKLPVNVLGLMGLVENMTGGSAYKLGDILTARNGVTIEVLNTDAEGRLVLADVLSYAVDLGVDRIVDLATLTGACVVALGEEVAGAMTNDQAWCDQVLAAGKAVGEDLWQLPMFDLYDELIKGDVGDIKNTGSRWGGAISAAKFLQRFVGGKPWVHLDIAGPAFASSSKPHRDGGATGAYVRTLVELAQRAGAGRAV